MVGCSSSGPGREGRFRTNDGYRTTNPDRLTDQASAFRNAGVQIPAWHQCCLRPATLPNPPGKLEAKAIKHDGTSTSSEQIDDRSGGRFHCRRAGSILENAPFMNPRFSILWRIILRNQPSAFGCIALSFYLTRAQAAPLMEEGFNYPAGTALATNPPWSGGTGASVEVVGGNLILSNLQDTVPSGNKLQIGGGSSRTVYRNFSSNAVTGGAVYCSALIRCTQLPTNITVHRQFVARRKHVAQSGHRSIDLECHHRGRRLPVQFEQRRWRFEHWRRGVDLKQHAFHRFEIRLRFHRTGQHVCGSCPGRG